MTLSVSRLYISDDRMKNENLKQDWEDSSCGVLKVLSWHLPEEMDENHEKPYS
jgi:hypothetical protein